MTLIHAGTSTSPPNVLKPISSARRKPISAWNLRSENHQKTAPTIIVVAVKMIVSGRLATAQDVQRFQIEAQAAAGLQHPNVVAIHEVGEHQGTRSFAFSDPEGRWFAVTQ